jgi:hypothetical protein
MPTSESDFRDRIVPGDRFRLDARLLALERPDGEAKVVYMRPGEIVTVKDQPSDQDVLVDVLWTGRTVMMFRRDLLEHGQRVMNAGAEA